MEEITEILDTLVGKLSLEMPPGKLLLYVASWSDVKMRHILVCQFRVFELMGTLLGHRNSLLEKDIITGDMILLGHQHLGGCYIWGQGWKGSTVLTVSLCYAFHPWDLVLL